ncbi:DUF6884 domain-containing protein [Blastococcus tunisiensis]|uniref:Uncharacterized protein n=1 Tax=Blastococcus tunisiensis TaxID=1798228 RepID=A0A1I2B741_9ACTN|nr:DUF6884 domain-containing protein [Blastococcus sp. DSM 46838]SFE51971.1 hypothetical protein SAMN05216574_10474 [Blastococcus sp. DSM 46838]
MTESIWDLLGRAAETLPEPFSRAALVDWVLSQRPDVEPSSVGVHIQYATANAQNSRNPFAHREPLLDRVGHGQYRRHATEVSHTRAPTPPVARTPTVPATAASVARVVLVGCSRSKTSTARSAAELFTGAAFTKARAHAEQAGVPWFVLSAKFGLLEPTDVVAPYDVYLADQSPHYRTAWGQWVVAQLAERLPLRGTAVEVHAGRAYTEPLLVPLAAVGATVVEPLAGLRQGERLAWYADASAPAGAELMDAVDVSPLLDECNTMAPAHFLARGRSAYDAPGLYSWWVDVPGAHSLSAGLGHRVAPGLVYAGRAGGVRASGKVSTNTLWGRVGGMHLEGNRNFSTFRMTLTAALRQSGELVTDEESLSRWMHEHMSVAVLPLPASVVLPAEERMLRAADPPLNLQGMTASPLRRTLTQLRRAVSSDE